MYIIKKLQFSTNKKKTINLQTYFEPSMRTICAYSNIAIIFQFYKLFIKTFCSAYITDTYNTKSFRNQNL